MVATTKTTATTKKDDKENWEIIAMTKGNGTFAKQGGDTIRDFTVNLFQNHPSEALRTAMKMPEEWNEATRKEWVRRC